jgi:hypothetical protein
MKTGLYYHPEIICKSTISSQTGTLIPPLLLYIHKKELVHELLGVYLEFIGISRCLPRQIQDMNAWNYQDKVSVVPVSVLYLVHPDPAIYLLHCDLKLTASDHGQATKSFGFVVMMVQLAVHPDPSTHHTDLQIRTHL